MHWMWPDSNICGQPGPSTGDPVGVTCPECLATPELNGALAAIEEDEVDYIEYKWQTAATTPDLTEPVDPVTEGWRVEDGPDGAWMPFAVIPVGAMSSVTYWRRLLTRRSSD